MVDFTFLEVHLDDAQFRSDAPVVSRGGDDTERRSEKSQSGGGRSKLTPILGILGVVALVVVARKLRSSGDETVQAELEDPLAAD